MSGQFLISPIFFPGGPEDRNAAIDKIVTALQTMTNDDLEYLINEYSEVIGAEPALISSRLDAAALVDQLEDLREILYSNDVNYILLDGETCFVAGGQSWGDSPSEAYDVFELARPILTWAEDRGVIFGEEDIKVD